MAKPKRFCTVPCCGLPCFSSGLCNKHRLRRDRGLPLITDGFFVENPTYYAAHARCKRLWGSASQYLCVCGCGKKATAWAYDGTDPTQLVEVINDMPMFYSRFPEFYMPMCRSCHYGKDMKVLHHHARECRKLMMAGVV